MLNNNSTMDEVIPLEFYLSQNYPNPFKEKTSIKYCVAYKTKVVLTVYNSEDEEIARLVDEEKQPGTYEVEFNPLVCHSGEGLPDDQAGGNLKEEEFFYRLEAGDFKSEKKMILQK